MFHLMKCFVNLLYMTERAETYCKTSLHLTPSAISSAGLDARYWAVKFVVLNYYDMFSIRTLRLRTLLKEVCKNNDCIRNTNNLCMN